MNLIGPIGRFSGATDGPGIHVKIELGQLIDTIYISPFAKEWFVQMLKKVVKRLGHDFKIEPSNLLKPPSYLT